MLLLRQALLLARLHNSRQQVSCFRRGCGDAVKDSPNWMLEKNSGLLAQDVRKLADVRVLTTTIVYQCCPVEQAGPYQYVMDKGSQQEK